MLQKVISFLKRDYKWLLAAIIILAAFLRFWGAGPGYPPYHSDEGISYSSAVLMIKEGNLDPGRYDYPSIVPLANFLLFKFFFIPIKWVGFYLTHAGQIIDGFLHLPLTQEEYKRIFQLEILGIREVKALIWGRYVTALFGVGTVFLTYLLGSKLFGKKTGLVSALLVAVNFRQVLNSHLGLPDIYNAFFLLLALLFIGNLLQNPSRKNYLLAGAASALYFSTKFQAFAFLPFLFAHLAVSWKDGKNLFSRDFFAGFAIIPFITLLLNPYLIIYWEKFTNIQSYQLLKYASGSWQITLFPFSYLFHIGLGPLISILVIAGLLWALRKYTLQAFILLTVVLQFFFIFTFYTRGGFYTRNFVTITPLLLLFAGFALERITSFFPKKMSTVILITAAVAVSWTNIANSVSASQAYSKPWNFQVLSDWVSKNIPTGARVSAHSSVPLPEEIERLPYDFHLSFSIEEFREDGADFAVANLDVAANEFYWWMGGDWRKAPRYWTKPIQALEQTYSAMALRELSDFALYAVVNPWQAPESNFIAAKIPQYEVFDKELSQTFGQAQEGWNSPPIEVSSWPGVVVEGRLKTENKKEELRTGFISVSFYRSLDDANFSRNRVGIRLTSRVRESNQWLNKKVVSKVPEGAKYMVVGFASYNPADGETLLEKVDVYKAEVKLVDVETFSPVKIDKDVLFPFSQGGL